MIESIDVINKTYNFISKQLMSYLEMTFYHNNHPKYHKFFKEWASNLTPIQIFYFEKQRINIIEDANIQH